MQGALNVPIAVTTVINMKNLGDQATHLRILVGKAPAQPIVKIGITDPSMQCDTVRVSQGPDGIRQAVAMLQIVCDGPMLLFIVVQPLITLVAFSKLLLLFELRPPCCKQFFVG